MDLRNLRIISAGAGSGKTYRLTSEMVALLKSGTVRPEGIIATTFTRKAAAELQERVRVRLLQEGLTTQAESLTNALIGTVHGLGVKLLQRFAYEAGVSPEVSIIADEDQQILFNQSLITVLTEDKVREMDTLCRRLGLDKNEYFDWRSQLRTMTEVARANDFDAAMLEKSKRESVRTFLEFLDPVSQRSADAWNRELSGQLEQAIAGIQAGEDGTKATQKALSILRQRKRELELRGELSWPEWARLSKLSTGAKSRDLVAELKDYAADHDQHPAFRADIEAFIGLLFDLAVASMAEYDAYKKQRGLIDYTDMEVLVKQLLDHSTVQEVLRKELDLLMVDEFQDTSPIQLAIFLKLSRYARQSIWVGDPKQSIYGFRGAAPELMQGIMQAVGGVKPADIQQHSWRSRQDIVYACNALFTKAFSDIPVEQVALAPQRTKAAGDGPLNQHAEPIEIDDALTHWHIEYDPGDNSRKRRPGKPWLENAIAHQVRNLLDNPVQVLPKGEKEYRAVRPGDIAILCRSNGECQEMAEALHRAGLEVAISRSGLLATAEAKLILAALKYLLNQYDSLSVAELLLLGDQQPLEQILEDRLEYLEQKEQEKRTGRWAAENGFIARLNTLRIRTGDLSSTEILEMVLDELDLRRIIAAWGNTEQRLANVDMLRRMARQYEDGCNRMHSAASLGGFLLWLGEQEVTAQDKQGAGERPQAVNVLTYHKSKGLEWPVVVCHSLEKTLRADVWGMELISGQEGIDFDNILGNRWMRYWVNPYDKQYRKTRLEERLEASEAKQQKITSARQEDARLLYVGLTRARDYLVFPTCEGVPARWLNRVWHDGDEEVPTLDPDTPESPWHWQDVFLNKKTAVVTFERDFEEYSVAALPVLFRTAAAGATTDRYAPYYIDERQHNEDQLQQQFTFSTGTITEYAPAFPYDEADDTRALGKVVKAMHTGWYPDYPDGVQLAMAEHLLTQFEVDELVGPERVVQQQRAFQQWLDKQFDWTTMHRKYPVEYPVEDRRFTSVFDVFLETARGPVLIQHSGFTGARKQWRNHATGLGLFFYMSQEALRALFPQQEPRLYLHLALQGVVLDVSVKKNAFRSSSEY